MTNLTHNSFLCVYFSSLHVSSNLVLIIRRINCINATLVYVTPCRSPFRVQVGNEFIAFKFEVLKALTILCDVTARSPQTTTFRRYLLPLAPTLQLKAARSFTASIEAKLHVKQNLCLFVCLFMARQPLVDQDLLIREVFISHTMTHHSR